MTHQDKIEEMKERIPSPKDSSGGIVDPTKLAAVLVEMEEKIQNLTSSPLTQEGERIFKEGYLAALKDVEIWSHTNEGTYGGYLRLFLTSLRDKQK